MKIVLLAAASSIHTLKWANGLCERGHEVYVFSQHKALEDFNQGVTVYTFPNRGVLGYFLMVRRVRILVDKIRPDLVNAHYASGYGTTARLLNYRPWVLSVWGSDVYDFPKKSFLHKYLVRGNLQSTDVICSTSKCMADETMKLISETKEISITPFGVDLKTFKTKAEIGPAENKVVIGTIKSMQWKYGVDTLIEAFAILKEKIRLTSKASDIQLELRLIGDGEQTEELKGLANKLGIGKSVKFVGRIPHSKVPSELSKLDIFVALSRLDSESFGVAVVEASASGIPVVVSDAGGLPEVTINGKTGFVVPRESPADAAEKLEMLVRNSRLRAEIGSNGRLHVEKMYSWKSCLDKMESVYNDVIEGKRVLGK
ncbi:glycosyltransferase family 4 protein [Idiomarina tyrosinivorans]|uniref:Glycosyltransferase family 4 protein n=1 Tax=Idiomarina tyrosinivorans TaxID=1445662 RepID=A0A432ZQY7_9GAMM|nr:glycosyltransferase [Idiomarina tyrosinivorans]RUO80262.1 glycosyltransferase family 4 protein [Idiomarina tyrosinivorans]